MATAVDQDISIEPKTDFVPLFPDWYNATFLSYTIRDHAADPTAKYKSQQVAWQDAECFFQVDVPDDDPVERRSWPKVPKAADIRSEMLQLIDALGAATMEDMLTKGIPKLRALLDSRLGHRLRVNIVEHIKQDGSVTDKIDGYSKLERPARPASRPVAKRTAAPADDEDESKIPF